VSVTNDGGATSAEILYTLTVINSGRVLRTTEAAAWRAALDKGLGLSRIWIHTEGLHLLLIDHLNFTAEARLLTVEIVKTPLKNRATLKTTGALLCLLTGHTAITHLLPLDQADEAETKLTTLITALTEI